MELVTGFLAGLIAAFSPCVIVLIPALVYRFTQKKIRVADIVFFAVSFIAVFVLSAAVLNELLTGMVKFGLQLGLGVLFIVMGILALLNKFNPLQFQLIKNPLLFGVVFALIASINPCTFSYLGVLIAAGTSFNLIITMLAFSIGLLIPALLFAIFGKVLLIKIQKAGKIMHYISQAMNILLIGIGIYLILGVQAYTFMDAIVSEILLVITFLVLIRSFFLLEGNWKKPANILTILALILILVAVFYHCNTYITQQEGPAGFLPAEQVTCTHSPQKCETCTRCITIFGAGALLGFIAVFIGRKYILENY